MKHKILGFIRPAIDRIKAFRLSDYIYPPEQPPPSTDPFDGYTRSIHVIQKFIEVRSPKPDGSGVVVRKVPSGLLDNSSDWIGDSIVLLILKCTARHNFTLEGLAESSRKRLLAKHKKRQV